MSDVTLHGFSHWACRVTHNGGTMDSYNSKVTSCRFKLGAACAMMKSNVVSLGTLSKQTDTCLMPLASNQSFGFVSSLSYVTAFATVGKSCYFTRSLIFRIRGLRQTCEFCSFGHRGPSQDWFSEVGKANLHWPATQCPQAILMASDSLQSDAVPTFSECLPKRHWCSLLSCALFWYRLRSNPGGVSGPSHSPRLRLSSTGGGLWPTAAEAFGRENGHQFSLESLTAVSFCVFLKTIYGMVFHLQHMLIIEQWKKKT